jgi:aminotransferase
MSESLGRQYQECARCVMDTSDSEIQFQSNGECSYCQEFDTETSLRWFPNDEGEKLLDDIYAKIRHESRNQEYDCILGLSGGVDSSFLALKVKEAGLRPLVVHVDAGWNSELAVYNIEQIVKYCGFELFTEVMDWEEVRDLQLAFLKSGVANQDVVQDHAFFASLYHFAVKSGIRYVISGGNIATECVVAASWHHSAMDAINLHAIHKKYGTRKLRQYKTISFFQYYFFYPFIWRMRTVRPLNYMKYDKAAALEYLKQEIGYKDYGRKHGESRFTKFFQNHYLPTKFGYDKRRLHYSSQVLTGSLTRNEAVALLQQPLYDDIELQEDKQYIAKKLGISVDELTELTMSEGVSYDNFPNWDHQFRLAKRLQYFVERILGRNIGRYA